MRYCINTLMFNENLSIFDKIKIASKAGYSAIEPWIKELEGINYTDIVKCCEDYQIQIPTVELISGWFENDGGLMDVEDDHLKIRDECKRRMEISSNVKSKYIIATPAFSHRNHFGSWQQGIDYFLELLELGKDFDCYPTIEFMGQTKQINNFDLCKKFIHDLHHEKAKMIIDSYHLWKSNSCMDEFKDYNSNLISVFHMSDADKNITRENHRDRDRVLPGDGQADLKLFAKTVKSKGDFYVNLGVYNKLLWQQDQLLMAKEALSKAVSIFED